MTGLTRTTAPLMQAPLMRASVLAAIGVLALSAVGMSAAVRHFKLYLRKLPIYAPDNRQLSSLAVDTASWVRVGGDHRESEEIEQALGTKNYVTRAYAMKGPDGQPTPKVLQLHCAYYTGMIDTVPHVPERCFVGGGMQIGEFVGDLPLPLNKDQWRADDEAPEVVKGQVWRVRSAGGQYPRLPFKPDTIQMRTSRFLSGDHPLFAAYFFIANGGHVARAEGVRLLAFDLRDSYAYYMKVQVTTDRVTTGDELMKASASLLDELLGDVMLCAPDWVDVIKGDYPPDNPARTGGAGANDTHESAGPGNPPRG